MQASGRLELTKFSGDSCQTVHPCCLSRSSPFGCSQAGGVTEDNSEWRPVFLLRRRLRQLAGGLGFMRPALLRRSRRLSQLVGGLGFMRPRLGTDCLFVSFRVCFW